MQQRWSECVGRRVRSIGGDINSVRHQEARVTHAAILSCRSAASPPDTDPFAKKASSVFVLINCIKDLLLASIGQSDFAAVENVFEFDASVEVFCLG